MYSVSFPDYLRGIALDHLIRLGRAFVIALLLVMTAEVVPTHASQGENAYEGHLLKGNGERIYVVEQGQRRWITTLETFTHRGYRWDDVQIVPDAVLASIPEGRPLRTGRLVRGSGPDIFLLEAGRQRWIPSLEVFEELGYSWWDIQPIRDVDLAGYPPGPPLYIEPLIRAPELVAAVNILASDPRLAYIAAVLEDNLVVVLFGPLPHGAIATYHIRHNTITVGEHYRSADHKALAAVLTHEAMHAAQHWRRPEPTIGGHKCYAWELEAFETQMMVWATLYGPEGKSSPKMNSIMC